MDNKDKKILCFDLDDTIIDDNYKFEITFCDCIKVILLAFETRAPQIDEVLKLARDLDNQKLLEWPADKKYKPERLLSTWLDTYERLCSTYKVQPKHHAKLQLEGLVSQNFEPPYYIIPGAIETLFNLQIQERFDLHLITAGTEAIQGKKITTVDLPKFFAGVHINNTGEKSEDLAKLVSQYGTENVVMIGNSLRSDINPALELGVKAIYIPRGSWHQFKAEPVNDKYYEIASIREVPDLLAKVIFP